MSQGNCVVCPSTAMTSSTSGTAGNRRDNGLRHICIQIGKGPSFFQKVVKRPSRPGGMVEWETSISEVM